MNSNSGSEPGNTIDLRPAMYVLLFVNVVGLQVSIALSSVAMGGAILLWIADLVRQRGRTFTRTPLDVIFLCYAAAELIATIFSIEPAASAVNAKRLFLILNMYLVLSSVRNGTQLFRIVGVTALVAALLSLIEIVTLPQVGGHFLRVSMFQYYLTEGGLKMFALLMLAPFVFHPETPRRWRVTAAAAFIVLILGLIVTQTRSSWLGFLAGAVVIALLRNKKLVIGIVALLILFALFAPQDYRDRAASMFDPNMKSNLSRIHMLTTGWRMFLDRPVTGTGDIDLRALYETYIVPIDSGEGGHLHNNYMMLLVTLGGIGFIVTMTMFVKVALCELESERSVRSDWLYGSVALGSLAAYAGFLVNGLFEWNFGDHEIAVFLWFTVGLSFAAKSLFLAKEPA